MVKVKCSQCGREYNIKPYLVNKFPNHFCSPACYGKWQSISRLGLRSKSIIVNCSQCGKPVKKQPHQIKTANFCSRQCFYIWRKGKYAGADNLTWLGGHTTYRGRNWDEMRTKALERDNYTCQSCGQKTIIVHHKVPYHLHRNYMEANRLENLLTLCNVCHTAMEIYYWRNHPEMVGNRVFPDCTEPITCAGCGRSFIPRSGRTRFCDDCCTATCQHCGKIFYSRKATFRRIQYCSKECFVAYVKVTLPQQVCLACGKTFTPDRRGVKYCSNHCRLVLANPRRLFFAKRRLAVQV